MDADRTGGRLAALDPESRALLELSLLRRLSDEDLAGMLGTEARRVRERREAVLEALGAHSEAGRAHIVAELRGEETEVAPVESPLGGDVPSAEVPGDEPSPARGPRRVVWAMVGGLTIAAVVALVLALGANDDSGDGFAAPDDGSPAEPPAEPVPAEPAPPRRLRPWRRSAVGGDEVPRRSSSEVLPPSCA